MWTMVTMQTTLEIPNPQDWTDTKGAAEILDRNRTSVKDFVDKGTITRYLIGSMPAFWVPELKEVRSALDRLKR